MSRLKSKSMILGVLLAFLAPHGAMAQLQTTDISPDFSFGAAPSPPNLYLDGKIVGLVLDPTGQEN